MFYEIRNYIKAYVFYDVGVVLMNEEKFEHSKRASAFSYGETYHVGIHADTNQHGHL